MVLWWFQGEYKLINLLKILLIQEAKFDDDPLKDVTICMSSVSSKKELEVVTQYNLTHVRPISSP